MDFIYEKQYVKCLERDLDRCKDVLSVEDYEKKHSSIYIDARKEVEDRKKYLVKLKEAADQIPKEKDILCNELRSRGFEYNFVNNIWEFEELES